MRKIRYTESQFARQLAVLFLSAPEDSEEEGHLCEALDAVCERMGVPTDEFVNVVRKSVEVHEVEIRTVVNAAGGEA
jgi:hypothetical protein